MDEGFYPIEERLFTNKKLGVQNIGVTFVDICGVDGRDPERNLVELKKKMPDIPGIFMLEAREAVLNRLPRRLPNGIQTMVYNFDGPQPFPGARAYLLRSTLSMWTDEDCVHILRMTASGMRSGHSRLLIFDKIMPKKASWQQTSLDWTQMALVSFKIRTEEQYEQLLQIAGLKKIAIWSKPNAIQSLIEAVLVDDVVEV